MWKNRQFGAINAFFQSALKFMEPIIISVAPNGARKTTNDHPNIPVTPETIGKAAKDFCDAGAALVHLHIRDKEQKHTLDHGIYREAIAEIRKNVGNNLIIQSTSESVGIYKPEQQMEMVRKVKPEAVSLAIRELVPDPSYEDTAGKFFHEVLAQGTMPQYILYSPDEIKYFANLRKRNLIPGQNVFVLFVLGKKFAAANDKSAWSQPDDLNPFLETFDGALNLSETIWATCAFGGNENACMVKVTKCGGNPRIGFENNHFMADGSIAGSNAALVKQFAESVKNDRRKIANADAARKILAKTLEPRKTKSSVSGEY